MTRTEAGHEIHRSDDEGESRACSFGIVFVLLDSDEVTDRDRLLHPGVGRADMLLRLRGVVTAPRDPTDDAGRPGHERASMKASSWSSLSWETREAPRLSRAARTSSARPSPSAAAPRSIAVFRLSPPSAGASSFLAGAAFFGADFFGAGADSLTASSEANSSGSSSASGAGAGASFLAGADFFAGAFFFGAGAASSGSPLRAGTSMTGASPRSVERTFRSSSVSGISRLRVIVDMILLLISMSRGDIPDR